MEKYIYIHICLFIYPIWQLWSFSDVWRFVFNPQTELMVCPKNHWVCPQTHKFVGRQAPALCQRKVALHQWSVVRHLKRCYSRMEFGDINFEWKIIEQTYIYIHMKIIEIADKIHTKYIHRKKRKRKVSRSFFRSVSLHFNEDIILTSQIHGETGAALKEHHVGKGICVSPSWQQLATSGFSAEPSNEKYYNMNHMSLYDVIQCKQNLPFLP